MRTPASWSAQPGTEADSYQEIVSQRHQAYGKVYARSEGEGQAAGEVTLRSFLRTVEAPQAKRDMCEAVFKEKERGEVQEGSNYGRAVTG